MQDNSPEPGSPFTIQIPRVELRLADDLQMTWQMTMKTHVIRGKFLTMLTSYSTHCSSLLPLSFLKKTIVSEFICDDRVMLPSVFRDLLDVEVGSRFPR